VTSTPQPAAPAAKPEALPPLTPDRFAAALATLGYAAAPDLIANLQAYAELLAKWQQRLNLVGPSTLADIWRRHFLDSAQLYPLLPANDAPGDSSGRRKLKVFDLGSGAGFPGLVLAAMAKHDPAFPGGRPLRLQLVESDRRKAAFLAEAVRTLDLAAGNPSLSEVRIRAQRAEAVEPQIADAVTARALAPLARLLDTAVRFVGPHTVLIFPKGQSVADELRDADKSWKMQRDTIPSRSDPRGVLLRISGPQQR
jgi:16S rRNA (guanine527-N7)-methyltransferase